MTCCHNMLTKHFDIQVVAVGSEDNDRSEGRIN
jgi:hypothetical protein